MIDVVALIGLLLFVFSQHPLIVSHILVLIMSGLELESHLVILLDFVEIEVCMTLPIIPTSANSHLFRPWDLLRLIAETVRLTLQPRSVFEDLLELFNVLPLRPPVVFLLEGE